MSERLSYNVTFLCADGQERTVRVAAWSGYAAELKAQRRLLRQRDRLGDGYEPVRCLQRPPTFAETLDEPEKL